MGHPGHGPGPVLCLVVAALLYCAARYALPRRLCGAPLLARFGRISYSFYLLHVIVLSEVFGRLRGLAAPSLLRDGLAVGGALALAVVAAVIWYLLLERPAIAWSRRVRLAPRGEV